MRSTAWPTASTRRHPVRRDRPGRSLCRRREDNLGSTWPSRPPRSRTSRRAISAPVSSSTRRTASRGAYYLAESTASRMTHLGKALVAGVEPSRSTKRYGVSTRSRRRRRGGREGAFAPGRLSAAGWAEGEPVSLRRGARSTRRLRRVMRVALYGATGKAVRCFGRTRRAGHDIVDARGLGPVDATSRSTSHDPMPSSTTPRNASATASRSSSGRRGSIRSLSTRWHGTWASRASMPPTSRSARCS